MKRLLLSGALVCALTAPSLAAAPSTMSYQGVLTDASGNLVADGPYDLTFKVWDVAVGGAPLWSEAIADVPVVKGGFSVLLGDGTPIALAFDKTYYLSIAVDVDPDLEPRVELGASPYAMGLRLPFSQTLTSASPLLQLDNTGAGQDAVFAGRADFGTAASTGEFRVFRSGVATEEVRSYTNLNGGLLDLRDEAGNLHVQIAPDGDGAGGFLNVFRNTTSSGLQLIGDFAGTGEPGFQVTGSARSCFMLMANNGNASVTLPTDAISALESNDEPGVASANATGITAMDGTTETLISRSLTVPEAGYCLVIGSAQVDALHTNGTSSSATFGVSDVAGSFPATQDFPFDIPAGAATGTYRIPVTVHGLFTVTAGTHTFYFIGDEGATSSFNYADLQLSVVYFATAYGTVTSTIPNEVAGSGGDDAVGRSLSAADVAREQGEARHFHEARLLRELDEMRARLDRLQRDLQTASAQSRR